MIGRKLQTPPGNGPGPLVISTDTILRAARYHNWSSSAPVIGPGLAIDVMGGKKIAVYLIPHLRFPEPCGHSGLQPSPRHVPGASMNGFASIPATPAPR